MPSEPLPTTLLFLVIPSPVSISLDNLENNHLYQYQNMRLLHRLSFLLGTLFPLKKDAYVSQENCATLHVPIRAAMFSRFVTRDSEGSTQYDFFYFPRHSKKHLLQIPILLLAHQLLHQDCLQFFSWHLT